MDEPTARLPAEDAAALLALMRRLSQRGTAIVFVSHFLEEVLSVAHRITVLRDGRLIRTMDADGQTPDDLVTAMLGREATLAFPAKQPPAAGAPLTLSVRNLSGANGVRGVSLSIRQGEIVALAGMVGSGRSEVARVIFGADPRTGGDVELDGRSLAPRSPREAIRAGVAYLPESRKDLGLFLSRSSGQNVTAAHLGSVSSRGLLSARAELREARSVMTRLEVKPGDPQQPVRTLSGGNQQKVLFAKWLWRRPKVLIADEPTRGVDVGAKFAIYQLLVELAESGMAILLISSDLEEVLGLAHRAVVLRRGRQVATLAGDELNEETILRAALATESAERVAA
jgi:ABC-type sugar transport system ATPase subunit